MVVQPLNAHWILWLGLLLPVAWGCSEYLRRRRLKRFGVLDASPAGAGWGVKIGGAALRTAGTCAAAAVLVLPFTQENVGQEGAPRIVMALDTATLGGASGAPWTIGEGLERAVGRVLDAGAGCRCAVYALGDPPHLLVPDTPDAQGILMMLGEAVLGQPGSGGRLTRQSLAELAARSSGGSGHTTLVVMTADSTDNIMRIPPPETMTGVGVVMLHMAPGSGIVRIAVARAQAWHWEPGPESLPILLSQARAASHEREEEWSRRNAPVRYLAGLALLLLGIESARGLLAPPQDGRR